MSSRNKKPKFKGSMWTWLTMASPTEIEFSKGLELQDT
jgi:hypothetical protein